MSFAFLKKILSRKSKAPKWSIVIDPGHGGKHPGAVNKKYGYMEKNINLHVAEFMRTYINDQVPELRVLMTRASDRTISLPERCKFANNVTFYRRKIDARTMVDAFISIHTNARLLKGRYGLEIETYYFRGSKAGMSLASYIQDELSKCDYFNIPVIDRGVKIGQRRGRDFYVLKHTHMPAVLVELGFLGDDEEAQLLIKPMKQELMAQAIVDGVVSWLEEKDG